MMTPEAPVRTRRTRRPGVELLESRTVMSVGFVVSGEALSQVGGFPQLVRVDGETNTRSVLSRLQTTVQLGTSSSFLTVPAFARIDAIARAADGTILAVGLRNGTPTVPVIEVVRVNPANGSFATVTRFVTLGINQFPVFSRVDGLAVGPDGSVYIAGAGFVSGFGNVPRVVRVNPTTGAPTLLAEFKALGFNVSPLLDAVDGLAVEPGGGVIVVGSGVELPHGLVPKVVRLDPATGTPSLVARFLPGGFNAPPLFNRIDGVAVAPNGDIFVAGPGLDLQGGGVVATVARVNPTTGVVGGVARPGRPLGSGVRPIDQIVGIAFAPVEQEVVLVGLRTVVGTPVIDAGLPVLVRVNPTNGVSTPVALTTGLTTTRLAKVTGVAAGLIVDSAMPQVIVRGPQVAARRQSLEFSFSVLDAAPGASYLYKVDWNGDGRIDQTVTGSGSVRVRHTYARTGRFLVSVTARRTPRGVASQPAGYLVTVGAVTTRSARQT